MTTTPSSELRDRITAALSEAGAFCGECGFEPGETGCPDCVRHHTRCTAAVLAVVQPELDRLAHRVEALTDAASDSRQHLREMRLDLSNSRAEADRLRAELEQARQQTAPPVEICEIPHATTEEEDACEQQRLTRAATRCTCGEGKATLHFSNCRLYTDQLLKPQKPSA